MTQEQINEAVKKFEALITEQSARSDLIKTQGDFLDYDNLDKIIIGVCGGDGIGPIITKESARVLEYMLKDEVDAGKIEFKVIDGLTIENRVKVNKAIPDDVMEELKKCHVIRLVTNGQTLKVLTLQCVKLSICLLISVPLKFLKKELTGLSSEKTQKVLMLLVQKVSMLLMTLLLTL